MNTPTFNLNLSFFYERDNLPSHNLFMDGNTSTPTHFEASDTRTVELKHANVSNQGSSGGDVFTSFYDEFPFLDELFTPFNENDINQEKPTVHQNIIREENQEENVSSELDSRHKSLDEDDLNAFSEANSEKNTKYSTKWATKTFKGTILSTF